jgi:thymidylate synthase ThyX
MTHRAFSRNASSSRAIPVKRLIDDVKRDPALPIFWGKNQPGMQSREELPRALQQEAKLIWLQARDNAVRMAELMADCNAHKQIVNRLIEPYAHINVVVTATEWDNFFALRLHPDAQPEIHELARVMNDALTASSPQLGQFHLPYVLPEEHNRPFEIKMLLSAARCARVSYLTHEGKKPDFDDDLKLANRLLASQHMSPFEHAARALSLASSWCANLRGWKQARTIIENPVVLDLEVNS